MHVSRGFQNTLFAYSEERNETICSILSRIFSESDADRQLSGNRDGL